MPKNNTPLSSLQNDFYNCIPYDVTTAPFTERMQTLESRTSVDTAKESLYTLEESGPHTIESIVDMLVSSDLSPTQKSFEYELFVFINYKILRKHFGPFSLESKSIATLLSRPLPVGTILRTMPTVQEVGDYMGMLRNALSAQVTVPKETIPVTNDYMEYLGDIMPSFKNYPLIFNQYKEWEKARKKQVYTHRYTSIDVKPYGNTIGTIYMYDAKLKKYWKNTSIKDSIPAVKIDLSNLSDYLRGYWYMGEEDFISIGYLYAIFSNDVPSTLDNVEMNGRTYSSSSHPIIGMNINISEFCEFINIVNQPSFIMDGKQYHWGLNDCLEDSHNIPIVVYNQTPSLVSNIHFDKKKLLAFIEYLTLEDIITYNSEKQIYEYSGEKDKMIVVAKKNPDLSQNERTQLHEAYHAYFDAHPEYRTWIFDNFIAPLSEDSKKLLFAFMVLSHSSYDWMDEKTSPALLMDELFANIFAETYSIMFDPNIVKPSISVLYETSKKSYPSSQKKLYIPVATRKTKNLPNEDSKIKTITSEQLANIMAHMYYRVYQTGAQYVVQDPIEEYFKQKGLLSRDADFPEAWKRWEEHYFNRGSITKNTSGINQPQNTQKSESQK